MVDHEALDAMVRKQVKFLSTELSVVLGIVFVVLGVLAPQYPVPCTVTGLVLFMSLRNCRICDAGTYDQFTPWNYHGRSSLLFLLVKAVQAAIAYQRQNTASAAQI